MTVSIPQPFYLPLALFLPPSHAVVHKELNLLYQFWIHTELVTNLGPLEAVLNTARYYSGVFILLQPCYCAATTGCTTGQTATAWTRTTPGC